MMRSPVNLLIRPADWKRPMDMELSETFRKKSGGMELDVIVTPNSTRSGIEGLDEWRKRLAIKVKAAPLDGKANKEVIEVLENITGCGCELLRGGTSRTKTVFIAGNCEEIAASIQKSLKR